MIHMCSMASINVFVYGTLKRAQPNHHHLLNASLGKAKFQGRYRTIRAWPLMIATEANLPALLPIENEGHAIEGEVYRVDENMLSFLDEFEDHPESYIRREISVEPIDRPSGDTPSVLSWCYFFNAELSSLAESDRNNATYMSSYSSGGDHGRPYIYEADETRLAF